MPDLKPGRELDALIAEKVMGWKKEPDTSLTYWKSETSEGIHNPIVPHYSTDIAAAWEVFDWLCKKHPTLSIGVQRYGSKKWCTIYGYHDTYGPNGLTAAHAICLDALDTLT